MGVPPPPPPPLGGTTALTPVELNRLSSYPLSLTEPLTGQGVSGGWDRPNVKQTMNSFVSED